MGFVRDSCNQERRPRCVATIPHVKKLLDGARAHGVLVLHSVPTTNPSGDYIVADLAPRPGEMIIPPNGPNKFLPYDLEFHRYPDAGHGFFSTNRPAYSVSAATDGWDQIFAFYGKYLSA